MLYKYNAFTLESTRIYDAACPFIVIRSVHGVSLNENDAREYETALRHIYALADANNMRFSILYDINISNFPPEAIHVIGNLMHELRPQTTRVINSTACIVNSKYVSGILAYICNNVYTLVKPNKFVSTEDDAYTFFKHVNIRHSYHFIHMIALCLYGIHEYISSRKNKDNLMSN